MIRGGTTIAVFQCPVCELRFALVAELDEHLEAAHPGFEKQHDDVEDEVRAAARRRKRQRGG